jgi:hypothetical protein
VRGKKGGEAPTVNKSTSSLAVPPPGTSVFLVIRHISEWGSNAAQPQHQKNVPVADATSSEFFLGACFLLTRSESPRLAHSTRAISERTASTLMPAASSKAPPRCKPCLGFVLSGCAFCTSVPIGTCANGNAQWLMQPTTHRLHFSHYSPLPYCPCLRF